MKQLSNAVTDRQWLFRFRIFASHSDEIREYHVTSSSVFIRGIITDATHKHHPHHLHHHYLWQNESVHLFLLVHPEWMSITYRKQTTEKMKKKTGALIAFVQHWLLAWFFVDAFMFVLVHLPLWIDVCAAAIRTTPTHSLHIAFSFSFLSLSLFVAWFYIHIEVMVASANGLLSASHILSHFVSSNLWI